jgi:hypothetical protein
MDKEVTKNIFTFIKDMADAKLKGEDKVEFPKGSGTMHDVILTSDTAQYIIDNKEQALQKINEKKKKRTKKDKKVGLRSMPADGNPKITKMDFLPDEVIQKIAKEKKIQEKSSKKSKKKQVVHDPNYDAPEGSARDKKLDQARRAYQSGDVKKAARIRKNMEKKERKKKSFKNVPRSDTGKTNENNQLNELKSIINDMIEEQKLDKLLREVEIILEKKRKKKKKKKKSSAGGLSAAVKKSLDKKADKRCLTRGSVYSEFRKGLAAYLSSGSRKGMSAHQWAHARVNSANPSKSWATVKKRKTCPKKKK